MRVPLRRRRGASRPRGGLLRTRLQRCRECSRGVHAVRSNRPTDVTASPDTRWVRVASSRSRGPRIAVSRPGSHPVGLQPAFGTLATPRGSPPMKTDPSQRDFAPRGLHHAFANCTECTRAHFGLAPAFATALRNIDRKRPHHECRATSGCAWRARSESHPYRSPAPWRGRLRPTDADGYVAPRYGKFENRSDAAASRVRRGPCPIRECSGDWETLNSCGGPHA